jgi:very-short-patch-repair endonuclease
LFSGYCIEIDGHEWHEKTKEQVRADKEKDRAYLKNGFIPVRFTGSEVYHDAKKCVDEFFEIMITNYEFFNYENLNIRNYMLYCEIHGEQK